MARRYIGKSRQKVDSAGRISVPAPLRTPFAEGGVVARHMFDRCLVIRTDTAWETITARFFAGSPLHSNDGQRARRFLADACAFERLDGHGRVLIPADLRAYAGITGDIVLLGLGDEIEVWAAEIWDTYWAEDPNGERRRDDAAALG
jgi:MraZ protein